MGHSDSEEVSKDKSEIKIIIIIIINIYIAPILFSAKRLNLNFQNFSTLPFFGLHPEIRSSKRKENDDVMFLGDTDQYVYFSRHFG